MPQGVSLTSSSHKEEMHIDFVQELIPGVDPKALGEKSKAEFEVIEQELRGMRVELMEVPSSESLVKLYEIQAKGRAYFERAAEIYRRYLRFSSEITLLKQRAEYIFVQEQQKVLSFLRDKRPDLLKLTKSSEERNNLILSFIPGTLSLERQDWIAFETRARINYNIIKSYQEQFKSVREDILVQLSIIKNLIALGGIKIDPEAMRAFKVIEGSYTPTGKDYRAQQEDSQVTDVNLNEGFVDLL